MLFSNSLITNTDTIKKIANNRNNMVAKRGGTKQGFREPIGSNPIYARVLFSIISLKDPSKQAYASDPEFLSLTGKNAINLNKQLKRLHSEGYLLDPIRSEKNKTVYQINWSKISQLFEEIYNEEIKIADRKTKAIQKAEGLPHIKVHRYKIDLNAVSSFCSSQLGRAFLSAYFKKVLTIMVQSNYSISIKQALNDLCLGIWWIELLYSMAKTPSCKEAVYKRFYHHFVNPYASIKQTQGVGSVVLPIMSKLPR